MGMYEKIEELRKKNGISQGKLEKELGIANGSISKWKKHEPKFETVIKIASYFKVSLFELTGEEDIEQQFEEEREIHYQQICEDEDEFWRKLNKMNHEDAELFISAVNLDELGKQAVLNTISHEHRRVEQIERLKGQDITEEPIAKPETRIFLYYGRIAAAGESYDILNVMGGTIEVEVNDVNRNADCTIGVSGDSMLPTFTEEDIVYVKKTTNIKIGDIGIFKKDNGIYIKELGRDQLLSHNDDYKPIDNGSEIIVLGKVLGKIECDYKLTR